MHAACEQPGRKWVLRFSQARVGAAGRQSPSQKTFKPNKHLVLKCFLLCLFVLFGTGWLSPSILLMLMARCCLSH